MKKLLKCVSVFALAFALMPIVKADGPAEAITSGNLTLKSIPLTKEKDRMWYPKVQEEFSEMCGSPYGCIHACRMRSK